MPGIYSGRLRHYRPDTAASVFALLLLLGPDLRLLHASPVSTSLVSCSSHARYLDIFFGIIARHQGDKLDTEE